MDIDDFSSSAVSGVKRKPGKLAGAGLLSPAEQAGSDAMESRPGVADELKNAIAKASPAQRAILTDPKQNGTALVNKPAYKPAIDDLSSAGMSTPPQAPPQPAPQPAPQTVAQLTARPSLGVADDVSNFAMRSGANLGNSAYGGLRGLATLMTGGGIDAAVEDSKQSPIPVVAPNSRTAMLEKGMGKVQGVLDSAGDRAQLGTEATGAAGSGVMGAISKAGISNLPMLLGVGPRTAKTTAMLDEAPAVGKGATAAPEAPMQATATPAIASKAAPVAGNSAAPSAGVAPTPVAPKATFANASPEMQKAIADSGLPAGHPAISRFLDADTLRVPIKISRGQAVGDGAMISDEMNSRGQGQAAPVSHEFYKEQGQGLAANMRGIRDNVAPDIPSTHSIGDIGQTTVDSLKTLDNADQAGITQKYTTLRDANGGQFPVDAPALFGNVKSSLSKELLTGDAPASQMKELQNLAEAGSMTMEQYLSLRRNLGNTARTHADGNTRMAAGKMIEEMEALPLQGGAAELKPLADDARNAARDRFQRIESNPALKAAVNDGIPVGEPTHIADNFINNYVVKGKNSHVANLSDMLKDDPIGKQALAAGTVEHLTSQLKANAESGNFSSDAYKRALEPMIKGQSPKINSLVDAATVQELQQVDRVARSAQVQPRGAYVNNPNTFVAALAHKAASGAEKLGNIVVPGASLGTEVRGVVDRRSSAKIARQSTDPGAALSSLSKLMKP